MAQYKTHARFNLFLALPLLIWALVYFIRPDIEYVFVFTGAYFYGTLFMNPDLDLAHQIKLFSVRGFLTLPFRSYSKIFRHRGISHSIPWGTVTRVLWLMMILILTMFLLDYTIRKKKFFQFVSDYRFFFLYGFTGLVLADFCHLILDHVPAKKRR